MNKSEIISDGWLHTLALGSRPSDFVLDDARRTRDYFVNQISSIFRKTSYKDMVYKRHIVGGSYQSATYLEDFDFDILFVFQFNEHIYPINVS